MTYIRNSDRRLERCGMINDRQTDRQTYIQADNYSTAYYCYLLSFLYCNVCTVIYVLYGYVCTVLSVLYYMFVCMYVCLSVCTVLYYNVLYCTVLYCTVLSFLPCNVLYSHFYTVLSEL